MDGCFVIREKWKMKLEKYNYLRVILKMYEYEDFCGLF